MFNFNHKPSIAIPFYDVLTQNANMLIELWILKSSNLLKNTSDTAYVSVSQNELALV